MKVLVTGSGGLLGVDLLACLLERGIDCKGVSLRDFDLTNMEYSSQFIMDWAPDVVVHCAAYTDVEKAETEPEKCRIVNVGATTNIANICREIDAKLVYISTDYVFSGKRIAPYETDSETGPLSVYGLTKREGETEVQQRTKKHFVVRTSWMFGAAGNNFVETMLRIGERNGQVNVVCDQYGSPTYSADLAKLILEMIQTDKYGIYHATNEGYCSWAEFAEEIFSIRGSWTKVNPVSSQEYPTVAIRPLNSRLSKKSLDDAGFHRLPDWKDALRRYLG